MTRFEAYIGTRLSELLPVVHWYGLDEIYRRRCAEHVGQVLYREFCPECERLAQKSWQIDAATESIAEAFLSTSIQHFAREIAAIDEEIRAGHMVPIRGGQLDSSSDAIGYVRGHWARLNDQWTAECMLQCYQPGLDYFSQLKEPRDWVVELLQHLHQHPEHRPSCLPWRQLQKLLVP